MSRILAIFLVLLALSKNAVSRPSYGRSRSHYLYEPWRALLERPSWYSKAQGNELKNIQERFSIMNQGVDINERASLDSAKYMQEPSCGPKEIFCEFVANYPLKTIESSLKNTMISYKDVLGVDEVPVKLGSRITDSVYKFGLCKSVEKIIYPKVGLNINDEKLFIVNHNKTLQGMRVEICQEENRPCQFNDLLPNGHNSSCQQGYIFRKLLAISPNGTIVTDLFKIPSCCSCVVSNPIGL